LQDPILQDTLKIAEAVRIHLAEKDCRHTIREIVIAALQENKVGLVTSQTNSTEPIPEQATSGVDQKSQVF
jgi:hypothetical protein